MVDTPVYHHLRKEARSYYEGPNWLVYALPVDRHLPPQDHQYESTAQTGTTAQDVAKLFDHKPIYIGSLAKTFGQRYTEQHQDGVNSALEHPGSGEADSLAASSYPRVAVTKRPLLRWERQAKEQRLISIARRTL